ncbi:MAG: hypothetical protein PHT69_15075 [Bacteroidales bacterium]|nr:hypothetical protein [Bacteroidales bacterium]
MTAYTRNFFKPDYTTNKNKFKDKLSPELKNEKNIEKKKSTKIHFEPKEEPKEKKVPFMNFQELVEKRITTFLSFFGNFVEKVLTDEEIS